MFYGVIIYMFFFDKKHHRPHIHAHYGDQAAVIAIDDGEVLQGDSACLLELLPDSRRIATAAGRIQYHQNAYRMGVLHNSSPRRSLKVSSALP
jgi:hypothetical protein